MPAPAARMRSTRVPCGTSSTSTSPASIRSSAGVRMPGRDEKDTISFLTCPLATSRMPRNWPTVPSPLLTKVRFLTPLSRAAMSRLQAKP
jgi:hypothetical protein